MNPKDLYRLRRMQLYAQRSGLLAQFAQQRLQELTLELERRYGLLAREATLNTRTGEIAIASDGGLAGSPDTQQEVDRGFANDAG